MRISDTDLVVIDVVCFDFGKLRPASVNERIRNIYLGLFLNQQRHILKWSLGLWSVKPAMLLHNAKAKNKKVQWLAWRNVNRHGLTYFKTTDLHVTNCFVCEEWTLRTYKALSDILLQFIDKTVGRSLRDGNKGLKEKQQQQHMQCICHKSLE